MQNGLSMKTTIYNALIRTHHITSRRKVAVLKAAAKKQNCYALLRSGGVPGIMFVQGRDKDAVQQWIDTAHNLRYKDYRLVSPISEAKSTASGMDSKLGSLEEVTTVRDMGALMEQEGLWNWWRTAMGFSQG